jgi:hypothetical protein
MTDKETQALRNIAYGTEVEYELDNGKVFTDTFGGLLEMKDGTTYVQFYECGINREFLKRVTPKELQI